MPVTKTVLNDVGSVVLQELVDSYNGQEVKVSIGEFAVADTATFSGCLLMTDVELVVTDILVGVESALANVDTDIIIDHDTDLSFGTPAGVILNVEGFDATGLAAGVHSVPDVTGNATGLVQIDFPFLLPAASAIRVQFINNEGTTENFFCTIKYHPADDLLEFHHRVTTGKVLRERNRVGA